MLDLMNLMGPFQLRISHDSMISRCFPAQARHSGTVWADHHNSHPFGTLSQPLSW